MSIARQKLGNKVQSIFKETLLMNVMLLAAITIDGFIARNSQNFADWTSPEDTKHFVEKTKQAGVVIMGATTYQTLLDNNRRLPGRRVIVYTHSPARFDKSIETTQASPQELCRQLESEGISSIAICGGSAIYRQFMEADMVDELFITVEPVIFGEGIKLFDQQLDRRLKLLDSSALNSDTWLFHYGRPAVS